MSQSKEEHTAPPIIVYGCDRCTEVLAFLDAHGLPYTLADLEQDQEASMLVAQAVRGQFLMSVVQIEDDFYSLLGPAEQLGINDLGE